MKSRAVSLLVALIFTFAVLAIYIYTITTRNYAQATVGQSTAAVTVTTVRGTIYDRNLSPFVNESREYKAALIPTATAVAAIREAVPSTVHEGLLKQISLQKPTVVSLSMPVPPTVGLRQFFLPKRYGNRLLAPHIIGYTDGADQGVTGLEKGYQDFLLNHTGTVKVSYTVNARGGYVNNGDYTVTDTTNKATAGLVLTLDKSIQQTVEDTAAPMIRKGAVIVSDPADSSILSMSSFPNFQPFTIADSMEDEHGALLNRAISRYDCGSVFKLVTAAAALDGGIDSHRTYTCEGSISVGGVVFHCHDRLGHQTITMEQAVACSCNVYFIRLAADVGAEQVYSMARKMGFTEALTPAAGISAEAALMPEQALLAQSPAVLANFSFGQGQLLASPLHIHQMIGIIANGGVKHMPTLIMGTIDENGIVSKQEQGRGETVISPEIASTLQKMLALTVLEGTGQSAAPADISAAGKTGTAETGQVNEQGERIEQSWFTGYFPAENPRFAITVLIEDVKSSSHNAAQVFCEISNNLLKNALSN